MCTSSLHFCRNHLLKGTHDVGFSKVMTFSDICPVCRYSPHHGPPARNPRSQSAPRTHSYVIRKKLPPGPTLMRAAIFTEAPPYFKDGPLGDRPLESKVCHASAFLIYQPAGSSLPGQANCCDGSPSTGALPAHPVRKAFLLRRRSDGRQVRSSASARVCFSGFSPACAR